ncbi:MAG: Triosephosphate isomerase [Parcubacteria group bacterium GW2011_GWB1_43_6]|nr:MAG: Triosephosphate isomerase [Parcubacteria group bacterium GW2011_GWB1_43_6]
MKTLIVANWKCNPKTLKEAQQLSDSIKNTREVEVVICPPFIYLSALKAKGAQDIFWEDGGAYTGEISPLMLKNMGVQYVIVGHSERRKYFKETNEIVNKKIKAALARGLKPILCIDKVSQIPHNLSKEVIIAYEPIFAIGTGKPCNPERAKKMRLAIERSVGGKNPILYGGSVNSQNIMDYLCQAGFRGLLVGGASLNLKEFVDIVKNVC